jgi:pimeloyl-ACP methyl ester carboxylesterase
MSRNRHVGVWRFALPLLALALLLAGVANGHAQLGAGQTSHLTAVDGTMFEVTSGVLRVPEARSGRGLTADRWIDLAIVRLRRTGALPSSSAHVVLAGGPGDSGVDQVLGLARQGGALVAGLMLGDVIGIDQRGTGRSLPSLASPARYGLPLDHPGSMEAWLPQIARVSAAEAARLHAAGVRLEAYNTQESADDVADVCKALGYKRATLWGRSYGTHLALATTKRHAALVERLVLISPEGLDHTWKLPSHVDAVLARLETRGAGDLVAPLAAILGRLRREPVTVATTHPQGGRPIAVAIGAFDVQWIVSNALGDPRALATLPSALREMQSGDFRRVAQIAVLRRERSGVQSAMKMMMDLSSGASPERRRRIDREATSALLGNAINFPGLYLSEPWGATDLGEDFRRPVRSDVPALLLVGDLDPRTPVENAREIAATLPRARVVVIENATHQFDVFGSAPIREVIERFLRGGSPVVDRIPLPPIGFQ